MTSRAASRPPAQCGMKMTVGRLSSPGRRKLLSLVGVSPAATAVCVHFGSSFDFCSFANQLTVIGGALTNDSKFTARAQCLM